MPDDIESNTKWWQFSLKRRIMILKKISENLDESFKYDFLESWTDVGGSLMSTMKVLWINNLEKIPDIDFWEGIDRPGPSLASLCFPSNLNTDPISPLFYVREKRKWEIVVVVLFRRPPATYGPKFQPQPSLYPILGACPPPTSAMPRRSFRNGGLIDF